MRNYQLFSRRTGAAVDFRPDEDQGSPSKQLRRLSTYLLSNIAEASNIEDCDDAIHYAREYAYRKIFTNTTHEDFLALDKSCPEAIDWLIAVHDVTTEVFRTQQNRK